MIIIISPAKQMKPEQPFKEVAIPSLHKKSEEILKVIRQCSIEDIMKLMKVKETIAKETVQRFQDMSLDTHGYAALCTYSGLQYKSMHREDFTARDWDYAQKHLRILSGFYGVVKPFDSIYPYRLELQCRLGVAGHRDLYSYWGDAMAQALVSEEAYQEDSLVLNLASHEYAKAVLPYLKENTITITFYIEKNGKLKTESTQVKMARGRMSGYLIRTQAKTLADVKAFREEGYQYQEALSSDHELVFVKQPV